MAIGPKYRDRCIWECTCVISGLCWVPREGGRGDRGEREWGRHRRLGHQRRGRQRGASVLAAPFGRSGTCSIAGMCLGVLGGRLGVWGGIFARPETAAIGIGILDTWLLLIERLNLLGSRGSQGWISGPRSLTAICPHLLCGLGPGALIGRETFPIWKRTVERSCVLNHGCEMRLHQPKTPDCPWQGGRTVT